MYLTGYLKGQNEKKHERCLACLLANIWCSLMLAILMSLHFHVQGFFKVKLTNIYKKVSYKSSHISLIYI